tara:strand:+ start:244 stop:846 length:603 start_codon:yes stop_codon:yes gene_type:complete
VIFTHSVVIEENDDGDVDENFYNIIQCQGCESVRFQHLFECRQPDDPPRPYERIYPEDALRHYPVWLSDFIIQPIGQNLGTSGLSSLLLEVYSAVNNRSFRIALMGIRSLIEKIMIQSSGDQGSFRKNLENFHTKGHISSTQRTILEHALEAGHASIHRFYDPSINEVNTALDITENLIESIYILPLNSRMKLGKIPRRS